MAEQMKQGWFHTKNRLGDRSIAQQMEGLDWLLQNVAGKSVLDVGCAEGLISIALAQSGAGACHGIEIVQGHVDVGNKLRKGLPCLFEQGDANDYKPKRTYDIVILLAVLHKLRNPTESLFRLVEAARETVVIRLPPYGSTIVDERSGFEPHDIDMAMVKAAFTRVHDARGPINEWVGVYRRVGV